MSEKTKTSICPKCKHHHITNTYVCDTCQKPMAGEHIILNQECYCWGNDSVEGLARLDFCDVHCLAKFMDTKPDDYNPDFVQGNILTDKEGWEFEIHLPDPKTTREIFKLLKKGEHDG